MCPSKDSRSEEKESATQDEIEAGKQTKLNLSSLISRPSPPAPSSVTSAPFPLPQYVPITSETLPAFYLIFP
jgi:hypothetical protein